MKPSDDFLNQLSTEARFLVELVRCHADETKQKPSLPENIQWLHFVELAYASHLAGIIFDCVMQNGKDLVPSEVISQLKSYQLRVMTSNERLLHQYSFLRSLADEQNLVLYPLKGITLMPHIYAQTYHRHISDIDVLISADELSTWEQLLQTHGYRTKRRFAKSSFHAQLFDKYDPLQAFKQEIIIDFHVSLNCGLFDVQLPLDQLRAKQSHAHELSPLDQLIFVCLHAYKHFYYGQLKLIHLMDIHHLSNGINATSLQDRCETFRCTSEVMAALNVSRAFLGLEHTELASWEKAVLLKHLRKGSYPRRDKLRFYVRRHFTFPVKATQLPTFVWYQLFPSAAYLQQISGKKGYIGNWFRRFFRLLKK